MGSILSVVSMLLISIASKEVNLGKSTNRESSHLRRVFLLSSLVFHDEQLAVARLLPTKGPITLPLALPFAFELLPALLRASLTLL